VEPGLPFLEECARPSKLGDKWRTEVRGYESKTRAAGSWKARPAAANSKATSTTPASKAGGRYKFKSKVKGAELKSLCGNSRVFVGRSFSYDTNTTKSVRFQPLKYRFRSCHTDSKAGRYKVDCKEPARRRRY